MKKDNKERLFEVMGRLDKTFKSNLNEGFEEIEDTNGEIDVPAETGEEMPAEIGGEETPEAEEKTPEEKLAELTAKVDEIYALVHDTGEEEEMSDDIPTEEPEEISIETGEVEVGDNEETELNEHHLKDRKSQEDFICKNDKSCKKEDLKDLSDKEVEKKYNALEKKMGIVD